MQSGKRAEVRKSKIQKYRAEMTKIQKKNIKVQIWTHVRLGRLEACSLRKQQKAERQKYKKTQVTKRQRCKNIKVQNWTHVRLGRLEVCSLGG